MENASFTPDQIKNTFQKLSTVFGLLFATMETKDGKIKIKDSWGARIAENSQKVADLKKFLMENPNKEEEVYQQLTFFYHAATEVLVKLSAMTQNPSEETVKAFIQAVENLQPYYDCLMSHQTEKKDIREAIDKVQAYFLPLATIGYSVQQHTVIPADASTSYAQLFSFIATAFKNKDKPFEAIPQDTQPESYWLVAAGLGIYHLLADPKTRQEGFEKSLNGINSSLEKLGSFPWQTSAIAFPYRFLQGVQQIIRWQNQLSKEKQLRPKKEYVLLWMDFSCLFKKLCATILRNEIIRLVDVIGFDADRKGIDQYISKASNTTASSKTMDDVFVASFLQLQEILQQANIVEEIIKLEWQHNQEQAMATKKLILNLRLAMLCGKMQPSSQFLREYSEYFYAIWMAYKSNKEKVENEIEYRLFVATVSTIARYAERFSLAEKNFLYAAIWENYQKIIEIDKTGVVQIEPTGYQALTAKPYSNAFIIAWQLLALWSVLTVKKTKLPNALQTLEEIINNLQAVSADLEKLKETDNVESVYPFFAVAFSKFFTLIQKKLESQSAAADEKQEIIVAIEKIMPYITQIITFVDAKLKVESDASIQEGDIKKTWIDLKSDWARLTGFIAKNKKEASVSSKPKKEKNKPKKPIKPQEEEEKEETVVQAELSPESKVEEIKTEKMQVSRESLIQNPSSEVQLFEKMTNQEKQRQKISSSGIENKNMQKKDGKEGNQKPDQGKAKSPKEISTDDTDDKLTIDSKPSEKIKNNEDNGNTLSKMSSSPNSKPSYADVVKGQQQAFFPQYSSSSSPPHSVITPPTMEPPSSMPLSLSPSAPPVTKKEPLDLETLREDVLATLAQSLHQLVESDMIKFLEKIEEYKGVIADPEVASDIFKLLENMKKNISKFEASLANATIAKSNEEQSKNGFS